MMSESYLQMLLAKDAAFLTRLQYLMVQQARVVKAEDPATAQHAGRSNYATTVINNPYQAAMQGAPTIVGGPNVIGTVTLEDTGPVTTASDAALLSQIATFWNALAGLDTPPAA
jgi:hypothetical protein